MDWYSFCYFKFFILANSSLKYFQIVIKICTSQLLLYISQKPWLTDFILCVIDVNHLSIALVKWKKNLSFVEFNLLFDD